VSDTTETSCRDLVELVTAYLDDALSAPERAAFEAHVAECPDCAVYLDQMRRTIAGLGDLPPGELSGEERETLLAAFRTWGAA
jgi:anti-sigma factor RsiW